MSEKRKKIVLSIEEKLKIIDRLKNGETCAKIVKDYGIGESTVRDIKKSENKLIEFVSNSDIIGGPSKRKTMKYSRFPLIDGKEIVFSVEEKLEIIEQLKKGETCSEVAKEYGIDESMIRNIKSEQKLIDYVSNFNSIGEPSEKELVDSSNFPLIGELLSVNIREKRKKIVLSIEDKLKIIDRLKNGESCSKISKEYGIGESTVRDIKKSEPKLVEYVSNCDIGGPCKRKTMKSSSFPSIDEALSMWFHQMRAEGVPISGPMCMQKAKEFHQSLNIGGEFNASNGWFSRFKKRHGIKALASMDETLVADKNDAEDFCENFKDFIEQHNLTRDQIYNADVTELFWKALPSKSLAMQDASSGPGYEVSEECITVLCCSNSSGGHKLKLVVIGKAKKPHCFNLTDQKSLPVNYYSQKGPWIESDIFLEWFHKQFIPEVRHHLERSGKPSKAVLLFSNSPSHPNGELLQSEDGCIRVYYLPSNVKSLIQPLEQGVIASIKFYYRLNLLSNLIKEENLIEFWKKLTILDAVYIVERSWSSVNPVTIQRSWNKIFGDCFVEKETTEYPANLGDTEEEEWQNKETIALILENKYFQEVGKSDLIKWLNCVLEVQGFDHMKNEDILNKVEMKEESQHCNFEGQGFDNIKNQNILNKGEIKEESQHQDTEKEDIKVDLSHTKSLECADYLIEYMNNNNFDYHELIFVKKIRSKIRDNFIRSKTETKITDFLDFS